MKKFLNEEFNNGMPEEIILRGKEKFMKDYKKLIGIHIINLGHLMRVH